MDMHLRASRAAEQTPAIPSQRTSTRIVAGRTDLTCATCNRVIAYGIDPEIERVDTGFYLELHVPFCLAAHT
jgi:hypothetical protein